MTAVSCHDNAHASKIGRSDGLQVMPPLDPSILVDHVKAQGRRERKNPASEPGGSSLWTLDPHERLLKMTLQKAQVPGYCVHSNAPVGSESVDGGRQGRDGFLRSSEQATHYFLRNRRDTKCRLSGRSSMPMSAYGGFMPRASLFAWCAGFFIDSDAPDSPNLSVSRQQARTAMVVLTVPAAKAYGTSPLQRVPSHDTRGRSPKPRTLGWFSRGTRRLRSVPVGTSLTAGEKPSEVSSRGYPETRALSVGTARLRRPGTGGEKGETTVCRDRWTVVMVLIFEPAQRFQKHRNVTRQDGRDCSFCACGRGESRGTRCRP